MRKILLILLLFPILFSAQINESDTLNLKARIAVTGIYQGGNVETLIFRTKTDLSFKLQKNWVFKNQNSYVYQAFYAYNKTLIQWMVEDFLDNFQTC